MKGKRQRRNRYESLVSSAVGRTRGRKGARFCDQLFTRITQPWPNGEHGPIHIDSPGKTWRRLHHRYRQASPKESERDYLESPPLRRLACISPKARQGRVRQVGSCMVRESERKREYPGGALQAAGNYEGITHTKGSIYICGRCRQTYESYTYRAIGVKHQSNTKPRIILMAPAPLSERRDLWDGGYRLPPCVDLPTSFQFLVNQGDMFLGMHAQSFLQKKRSK